ncbi:hypothetical protein FBU31_000876 [Coemansia sp. 'formosensis']|nr:hypothetical protein FBU31_000876 [Coemansia sp. 'formosensis']
MTIPDVKIIEEVPEPTDPTELSANPHTMESTSDIDDLADTFGNLSISVLTAPTTNAEKMEVQLLHDNAMMPHKAHENDASFDVHCMGNFTLEP